MSAQPCVLWQHGAASSIVSPCHDAESHPLSPSPAEPVIPTTWGKEGCSPTGYPLPGRPYQGFLSFFFFFFNNEAKIKILYFHYYPFSQPAEQKHKALLLLPLAPQPCLFLPWSSIKERRKLKLFYARRLQHAYLIFMMDLNC